MECVNGEIFQEPNNVGSLSSLNKSIVRLDTNIPVAEALGNYIEYTYKVILYLDYKLYETNNFFYHLCFIRCPNSHLSSLNYIFFNCRFRFPLPLPAPTPSPVYLADSAASDSDSEFDSATLLETQKGHSTETIQGLQLEYKDKHIRTGNTVYVNII